MPVYIKKYISQDSDNKSITSVYRSSDSGDMYGLISISNAPDGYAHRASKFVWEAVVESYESSTSTIDGIKGAVVSGSKKVLELMKNDKSVDEKGIDLNFAIIVIKDATAYLGHFGEQEIYVFKDGEIVNVTEVLSKNRVVAASFALGLEDSVVFASPGLFSQVVSSKESEELPNMLLEANDRMKSGQGLLVISRTKIDQDFSNIEDLAPVIEEETEDIEDNFEKASPEPESIEEVQSEERNVEDANKEAVLPKNSSLGTTKLRGANSFREKFSREKLEEYRVIAISFLGKVGSFFLNLYNKISKGVSPTMDWLGRFTKKLSDSFWRFIDNKYGRQVWYKRMKSKLSAMRLTSGASAYGMKIDGYKETTLRGKRVATLVLIVLIIVVVLGGVRLSIKAREARDLHREATIVFEDSRSYIKQAEENIHTDASTAQGYLFQAGEQLKKIEGKELSVADQKAYKTVKESLEVLEDRLARRVWISDDNGTLETYISTRLEFGSDSKPSDITVYKDDYQNESLFIVDNGLKGVYRVNLYDKGVVKIPDKNGLIKSPKFIDIGVNGVYVFDEISGVVRSRFDTKLGNLDFENLTGLNSDDLGINDVTEFAVFAATDNIYLLSPSQKAIFKSNFVGGGYTLPYTFISSEEFAGAKDFFGDNVAIYATGSGDLGVHRFEPIKGDPLPISITGSSTAISNVSVGFTAPTLDDYMYIFEGGNIKRILVLEKPKESIGDIRHPNELLHIKEFRYRGSREDTLSNVKDLVTDYQGRYLYILDGTIVRRVEVSK